MERIVLWGSGQVGRKAYEKLIDTYNIIAWGDNDVYKHNLIYKGLPVISFEQLVEEYADCKVVLSLVDYYEMAKKLNAHNIQMEGYYDVEQEKVLPWKRITWEDIKHRNGKIRLYAGDINTNCAQYYPDDYVICLSLERHNYRSMKHDIRFPYPLEANTIDSYQIEDVIEHIEIDKAVQILNEIYRILKEGGYLRLSLPDYHAPVLLHNSFLNSSGGVLYDPYGGGKYVGGKVCDGGHVWFPTYGLVREILEQSDFKKYKFYRYYDVSGKIYGKEIDYSMGYISRTKEHLSYKEDISIVVDCYK